MSKNNNNWQELKREEKQFKDDRNSNRDRVKQPYKRDRNRIEWSNEEDQFEDPYYGDFESESD